MLLARGRHRFLRSFRDLTLISRPVSDSGSQWLPCRLPSKMRRVCLHHSSPPIPPLVDLNGDRNRRPPGTRGRAATWPRSCRPRQQPGPDRPTADSLKPPIAAYTSLGRVPGRDRPGEATNRPPTAAQGQSAARSMINSKTIADRRAALGPQRALPLLPFRKKRFNLGATLIYLSDIFIVNRK